MHTHSLVVILYVSYSRYAKGDAAKEELGGHFWLPACLDRQGEFEAGSKEICSCCKYFYLACGLWQ